MPEKFSATQRLLVVVLMLGLAGILVAYFQAGLPVAILVSLFLCIALWLTRFLWLPPGFGATRVRLASIGGIFVIAGTYGVWSSLVDSLANQWLHSPAMLERWPALKGVQISSEPSLLLLLFVLAGVFIVNYFLSDRSISGRHPTPLEREFPEEEYPERLARFCRTLRRHLLELDQESNWSPDYYIALDADVEIQSSGFGLGTKRVTDLISALRSEKDGQAFLVLGDPGAGKSVALRKLARDMLEEVKHTERVPVYINLREWLPQAGRWSHDHKPNIDELTKFVIKNIKDRGDFTTTEFMDQYFARMWERGRLFFIVDSFDEIPQLLDVPEDSWLIGELSSILWKLIAGHETSRGVLASRFFRRPTSAFEATQVLDVRPFSEEKIAAALKRYPKFDERLRAELFLKRSDLVPTARNPFLMTLLGGWVEEHGSLPLSHAAMYESHLRRRLVRCAERMAEYGLSAARVLDGAREIAWYMYRSADYGLEAPSAEIAKQTFSTDPMQVIDILAFGRIGRRSTGDRPTFAFAHRRFLEYFVAQKLVDNPQLVQLDDIPTDSRSRDALVLFAQLADEPTASKLALFCWSEVTSHFNVREHKLRAIHSLRFLSDAFRARRAAIEPFADDLAAFVYDGVKAQDNDILVAKHCLEATGLLKDEYVDIIIGLAITSNNEWLQETAFRSCRHLPRPTPRLEGSLGQYIWDMSIATLLQNRRSLLFSLSLSEALQQIRNIVRARLWDIRIAFVGTGALLLVFPLLSLYWAGFSAFILMIKEPTQRLFSVERWVGGLRDGTDWVFAVARLSSLFIVACTPPLTLLVHWLDFDIKPLWGEVPDTSALATLDTLSPWPIERSTMLAVAALPVAMVFPWIGLMLHPPRRSGRQLMLMAAMLAGAMVVFAAVGWILEWLGQWVLWLLVGLGTLPLILLALASLPKLWHAARLQYQDWRIFRSIARAPQFSRAEIVATLTRLQTTWWRRRYVQQLADWRVSATGEWPVDFALADRGDPAITDLARLEERWLGLDR